MVPNIGIKSCTIYSKIDTTVFSSKGLFFKIAQIIWGYFYKEIFCKLQGYDLLTLSCSPVTKPLFSRVYLYARCILQQSLDVTNIHSEDMTPSEKIAKLFIKNNSLFATKTSVQ